MGERGDRRGHEKVRVKDNDVRTPFQRDRDRILYSSAFRRLAGVTQVVSAAEGHIYHNRLTHSLKVAQVARRLAERSQVTQRELADEYQIDADVCEAAALAHDLGHPPFGHIADEVLNDAVEKETDGFEGNPQSFRVVTRLAATYATGMGLDLTRATLNAIIKYPWARDREQPGLKKSKWGYYPTESEAFAFAREGCDDDWKSAEAEVMEWADDVTYAVHDLDDFHRAGLVPLHDLQDEQAQGQFIETFLKDTREKGIKLPHGKVMYEQALQRLMGNYLGHPDLRGRYRGTLEQQRIVHRITATLIDRYMGGLELVRPVPGERKVKLDPELDAEISVLKQFTRQFVIGDRALGSQQYGQKRLVRQLFECILEAINKDLRVLPAWAQAEVTNEANAHRVAADVVSSLAEEEATKLFGRLTGFHIGSITDVI